MLDLCRIIFGIVVDLVRPRAALEAEILVLRQQIIVLRRGRPSRVPFLAVDRMVLGWVCQLFPKTREALAIVRPDTVVRWHRAGFRLFWRWKSRSRPGRPAVPAEIRQLIRQMSVANPLWGAPSTLVRPASSSIWRAGEDRRPRVGRRSCAIMRMVLQRWICSWCRPFRFGCSMGCSSWATAGDKFCGSASQRSRRRNGLPTGAGPPLSDP
jgi:hypothetical protein